MSTQKHPKICPNGHEFYKSSDCPTCPTCAAENKPSSGFLSLLSSPARNTLIHHGVDTIEKLASYTEKEVLSLHGMGQKSMPTLKKALKDAGLVFRN